MISDEDILMLLLLLFWKQNLNGKSGIFIKIFFFCNKNISILFSFWAIFYPLNIFFIISLYIIAYIFFQISRMREKHAIGNSTQ